MHIDARKYFDEKLKKVGLETGTLEKRVFSRQEISGMTKENLKNMIKKVHIIGICGKGTSSLAGLFKQAGFEVSGSDTNFYPPASDLIDGLGIKFYQGFYEENLKDKDLIIVANMFGPDNVEVRFARENRLLQMSMPEAIETFFIGGRKSIVIAGTHGKTTTTGMMAHMLISAGKAPGFLVGGTSIETSGGIKETSFDIGDVDLTDRAIDQDKVDLKGYFVIEGDEYDTAYFDKSPKFLHYKPDIAVITSLEFDHADIYTDFEEYKQSFIFLVKEVPKDGLLVLNGDIPEVRDLAQYAQSKVLFYGLGLDPDSASPNSSPGHKSVESLDIYIENLKINQKGQYFDVIYKGKDIGGFSISLFGQYNILNALSVIAICLEEGLAVDDIKVGLPAYLGMKRRQEVVYEDLINNITIIDDFAHHPTAVKETLSGIKDRYKGSDAGLGLESADNLALNQESVQKRRIIAVFEPRSVTSRKKMFEKAYSMAFSDADLVYISMPDLREVDNPSDFIDGNLIVSHINRENTMVSSDNTTSNVESIASGTENIAFCVKNAENVLQKLVPEIRPGDVIVIMSNGSFDGIHQKLVSALKQ
jgi:UDP-N-acetylmuramate: L-alanyl-gamma-D-glutamyl-meso-diaminopimelate ligase